MYTSPVILDNYSRIQSVLFDENKIIRAPIGGQSLFGGGRMGTDRFNADAEVFESHISRGDTSLAPMIPRGTDAEDHDGVELMSQEDWTEFARIFPLIEDGGYITSKQIAKRIKGEFNYQLPGGGGLTKQERTLILANQFHMEGVKRSIRTMEYLAWQSILNGTMPILVGATATNLLYDWKRDSTHAAAVTWSPTGSDIMGGIDTGRNKISENAHVEPELMFCGDSVLDYIVSNDAILATADNRRMFDNEINIDNVPENLRWLTQVGFEYRGRLTTKKGTRVYLFGYRKFYNSGTITSKSLVRYLPINKAVLTSSENINDRIFGPDDELPMSMQERQDYRDFMGVDVEAVPPMQELVMGADYRLDPRWFRFGMRRKGKTIKFYSQIAPVFQPVNTDGWYVFTAS
jgi:hypothetical protein